MDAAALSARARRSRMACYRWGFSRLGEAARGVDVADGLFACIVPATPNRSVLNSVLYADPEPILARHAELLALYDGAGCSAWAVWVHDGDDALVEGLLERGHHLDAEPTVMGAVLEDMDLEPRLQLDLDPEPRWPDVGPINEAAYGLPAGTFAGAVELIPGEVGLRPIIARIDGRPAACAAWLHSDDGDCAVQSVATLPAAQGRGLGGELLREALRRAHTAGCTTTTLDATAAGAPVYERLGYRALSRVRMLEHRRTAA